jgi:hypothetical protein
VCSSDLYHENGSAAASNGHKYLGLGRDSCKCQKYSFMLQLIVNLKLLNLSEIYLNSEKVIIINQEGRYEIRNVYTTNKTEYGFFPGNPEVELVDVSYKHQLLPLIPLDRQHPDKTLQRIKNLLIFT